MKKIIITSTLIVAAAIGLVGGVSAQIAAATATKPSDTNDKKVTICHRTRSFTNPYVKETVNKSSIVDTGAANDKNKHDHHNGPVFDGETKPWGDIIPAFDYGDGQHYAGKNIAAGQAILDNGCKIPAEPPVEEQANITAAAVCSDKKTGLVTVTLTNSGNASGIASINDTDYTVGANATKDVTLYDTGAGAKVTVMIGDTEVLNQTIACHETTPGTGNTGGNTTPVPSDDTKATTLGATAPVAPAAASEQAQATAASLPYTGANNGLMAIVASVGAAVAAGASYLVRRTASKQF